MRYREAEMQAALREWFPDDRLEFEESAGQPFVTVDAAAVTRVLWAMKRSLGFDFLVDLTAVDYPLRAERFDLVYTLYSFPNNQRFRVKTRVSAEVEHSREASQPESIVGIYPAANWLEREVYDMFGIVFRGHPGLKRILMPEEWIGFPLRKDYAITRQDQAWVQEHLNIESGQ